MRLVPRQREVPRGELYSPLKVGNRPGIVVAANQSYGQELSRLKVRRFGFGRSFERDCRPPVVLHLDIGDAEVEIGPELVRI